MRLIADIFVFFAILLLPSPVAYASTHEEALRQLIEKADEGDPKSLHDLAYLYENGLAGIEKNRQEAIRLYTLSAEAGYAPAQNYLGFCYYKGEGVPRDAAKSLFWIQKAAEQGDIKSYNNLGWLLLEGDGVVHDASKAAYWFSRAADEGLPTAQCQLADLFKTGVGVKQDSIVADSLYHKAMYAGLADAEQKLLAMNYNRYLLMNADDALNLAKKYYYDTHFLLAVTLFEIAEQKGSVRAKTFLGECYAHAYGVSYDFNKALAFYYDAAIAGDAPAQFIIAETIEMIPDVIEILFPESLSDDTNPFAIAHEWYEKAAKQGVIDAATATKMMKATDSDSHSNNK